MAIEEVKEYSTTEVPAFGQLIKGILELTKAGVIKWRNRWDKDSAYLRVTITGGMRSSKGSAVAVEVGGNFTVDGRETSIPMPNHSVFLVAGDETKELNVFLRTYPVDTDETDEAAATAALTDEAAN